MHRRRTLPLKLTRRVKLGVKKQRKTMVKRVTRKAKLRKQNSKNVSKNLKSNKSVHNTSLATNTLASKSNDLTGPGCLSDAEIGTLCKSGQYSTYAGSFYNAETEKKFLKVAEVFKERKGKAYKNATAQEKYVEFLKDRFSPKSDTATNNKLIKNDFFDYVNGEWMKNTGVDSDSKYYVQIDNFRIKQEEVYYKLIGYVQDYIKNNAGAFDQFTIAIDNFYKALTTNTKPQFRKHAIGLVKQVEDFFGKKDMYGILAEINKNEIIKGASPISWSSAPDEKNVKQYISHLSTVQLGIYDFMIYFENPAGVDAETQRYYKKVKSKYFAYIKQVFAECLPADMAKQFDPQHVWDIEVAMLEKMSCTVLKRPNPNYYNLVTAKELQQICDFDWTHFATLLGFKTVPPKIVVGNLNAIKCMTKYLNENWNTPQFKTYWVFIQLKQMIRFENDLRHIHFDFYNKFLEGQPVIMPKEIYPIFMLSFTFNTFLSRQYIKHNYNPLYVSYVKQLVGDLKALFMRKIGRNTWMMPQTRKYALHKLKKLDITVGVPKHLTEDPLFDYRDNDPLANIGLLLNWKLQQQIVLEGKPIIDIPTIDWKAFKLTGTQCYIVNAFYASTSNSIYIPLAIIQNPFIDLNERGLEYNLVYIGYTITHELSHSLDNTGSRYDAEGNMRDWWQPQDRKVYDEKIADVVKQYEEFARRDGITFDASIASGENLADISGLAIIEEYLMDNQVVNDEITRVKKLNLAKFYMNLAIQARQKLSKEAIKAQLKMNPHPLDKYRVNCPLSRLPLFRTIFDIKKGDGMWWHNTDTIW